MHASRSSIYQLDIKFKAMTSWYKYIHLQVFRFLPACWYNTYLRLMFSREKWA